MFSFVSLWLRNPSSPPVLANLPEFAIPPPFTVHRSPVTLAFVAFAASIGLGTRLGAEVDYIFAYQTIVDTFDASRPAYVARPPEYEANRPYVARELWVRLLIPPPLRQRCYTSIDWVCEKADQVLPGSSTWGSSSYFKGVGLAGIPMLVSGTLAWLFTQRKWGV